MLPTPSSSTPGSCAYSAHGDYICRGEAAPASHPATKGAPVPVEKFGMGGYGNAPIHGGPCTPASKTAGRC